MSMFTTTAGVGGVLPDDHGPLVVRPALAASVAASVSTTVSASGTYYRVPIVAADPTAAWVAEGAEIVPSDSDLRELVVTPKKVAGLTIISRELADDSDPAAAGVVGLGLARDIARKIDDAYFGSLAAPAPPGLGALVGVTTRVAASAFQSLDAFAGAISDAETVGATVTSFIVSPATALQLALLKTADTTRTPLLGADATRAGDRRILGVPLLVSPSVAPNVAWAVDSSRVWLVVRTGTEVTADRSVFFTSDRVAVRAVMRVGFAYPHPASVVRISTV